MSRRAITLTAIASAFVVLVLTIILWPRTPERPAADETTPAAEPPATRPVAVFIGDSYTVGAGTTLSGTGFPVILGTLRDWEIVNLGVSGTGYAKSHDASWCETGGCPDYAGVIPDAVSYDPEVVVVSGGRNDLARSTAELEPAVTEFYTQLREALPDARIIVTSPIWDDPPPPRALLELSDIVEREADRIGAEYLDLGDPLEGRPDLIASDGLHPNEDGLQLIAERIDELLGDPLVE
ncbi:SGNH/GDSL hydrolase family protein [Agrococcus sp. ARC_14]|uniref:SGNH/GDSL hydrolase family protein n=1 Tax=Agrococcus sp. ARC_14 TaxID=2919927 RepID=UPI001F070699|nr:SGNH/GDSL hydrolase family protein [Agrococcus sp. ARC_14]MCH1884294.1 SGNH/GDSL hydrolase family protein [Agrococcus sp. ARC_14]